MAGNTGPPSSWTMRRWTTAVVVAANIAFIADYSILSESATITEVVTEYGNMFVPTGFAQAICAAILVAFMLFYFDALWPRRHRIRVYDKLVIPLAMDAVIGDERDVRRDDHRRRPAPHRPGRGGTGIAYHTSTPDCCLQCTVCHCLHEARTPQRKVGRDRCARRRGQGHQRVISDDRQLAGCR